MATTLQKNIDKYMDLKGIKYYSDLLYQIGKLLGKKAREAREFAAKEKSNFSKMLKGERPLKYDYIIPLEKIFGIPLAKLLDEQIYFENINKEDIPFLKSFRFYAYKDEPELYDELDKTATIDGEDIINNSDEYNRFFFDYLIEYKAYNGLKHMVYKHNLRLSPVNLDSFQTDEHPCVCSAFAIEIAKFVIDSNDPDIFNKVFGPFEYFMKYSYRNMDCLYTEEKFIKAILNNYRIFKSLFDERKYPFEFINKTVVPKDGKKHLIYCVNPLLNVCLDYCLKNLASYKEQAKEILEFGSLYNKKVLEHLTIPLDELYPIDHGSFYDRCGCCYGNLIYADANGVEDKEIKGLIDKLPKIRRHK